jgi:predicted metal-dependent HD superfamily phosphohydrolase
MSKTDQPILQEAQQYVKSIFASSPHDALVFHSLDHTRDVVRFCDTIANHYGIPTEERLPLMLAAWFHDTGYTNGIAKSHEEESQRIATKFLRERNADQALIDAVNACIIATKMPQSPTTLNEQIICDADLFHLGTDEFEEKNRMLRQEVNAMQDEPVSKKEWRLMNIEFLQRHRYFTDYGRDRLEPVKQRHLENLLNKQSKKEKSATQEKETEPDMIVTPVDPETLATPIDKKDLKGDDKDKDKMKPPKTERGVVAMFRIMSENHINLSQMADSKANIMISVNTIVISIMVTVVLGRLQFFPEYIVPTVILVGVCLGAVVFAILATRPNISEGTFTKEDIENKKINLLFFGNFYNMELEQYDWAMKEMMNDKDYLYGSMIKDIYFLGVVLARKYKFLRISYNVFMYGLIASMIAFGIAMFIASQNAA